MMKRTGSSQKCVFLLHVLCTMKHGSKDVMLQIISVQMKLSFYLNTLVIVMCHKSTYILTLLYHKYVYHFSSRLCLASLCVGPRKYQTKLSISGLLLWSSSWGNVKVWYILWIEVGCFGFRGKFRFCASLTVLNALKAYLFIEYIQEKSLLYVE